MGETYSKKYRPIGEATFGHIVFREVHIQAADLTLNVAYTSNDLTVDFYGCSRQAFKVVPVHAGGGAPTVDVEIQEFIADPVDPNTGVWVTKGALGVASADRNELFEHNSEDTMRLARLRLTPKTAVVDGGILVEMSGRRDT